MSVPNYITIARFFLIPVFIFLMLEKEYGFALIVFALAGITDAIDGYIARKYNMITKLGKILDPLADKLVLFTGLVMIAVEGLVPNVTLIIVVIACKELLMGLGSFLLYKKGFVVSANWYGKISTIIFYAAIVLSIVIPRYGFGMLVFAMIFAVLAFVMYFVYYVKMRRELETVK